MKEISSKQEITHIVRINVARARYEATLRSFYSRLKAERADRVEKTGDSAYTEFEALMPQLVNFLLPDRKCRAITEYDPAAEKIKFFQEDDPAEP